ncbi:DMT family transporter [Chitinophaga rhizophila]|uniref:DMT family transporter n=1 Tax=Chitinophaga rhizophila TaxID=2866212 RepID=A0ABS7G6U7_9BACT|nr:DMT family transporter [Chitinophaga rhizophila]MBW8683010.1 DMT family transporter [Chitinophaga rhizophila]
MNRKYVYLLLVILGTSFWGISFSLVKMTVQYTSQSVLLFYKFAIAALVLSIIFFRQLKQIDCAVWKAGMITGAALMAGTSLQTMAIKHTSVSNAAFLSGLATLLIPILKMTLYRKQVSPKIWFACIVALVGLYMVAVQDGFTLRSGDIWAIAGAVAFSFYIIYVGKYATAEKVIPSVITMMTCCAVGSAVMAIFDTQSVWIPLHADFWWGILFIALPATAFMYAVSNTAQRYIGDEGVAIAYLFEPIFAAVAGVYLLNEHLTVNTFIGGGLIILAMFISEYNFPGRKLTVKQANI